METKPKLVAFDLDGTLAESKQPVSARMGELLSELLEKMPVAVMSGASFAQFEAQFIPSIPDSANLGRLYIFPNNAARCSIYKDGKWQMLYDHSLNPFERGRIMQALKEALAETGLSEAPEQVWGERIEDRGAQISFSPLGQQAPVEAKKEWYKLHNGERKALWQALTRRLSEFSISMGGLTTIDITKKGISKAYGIRYLIKVTGISVSEMLYVGDALKEGGNDAVVKQTGVRTQEVFNPDETAELIENILNKKDIETR